MRREPLKPRHREERDVIRFFLFSISVILLLSLAGVFVGVASRDSTLIRDAVLERGRSLFLELVLVRRWVAGYGGVYVLKKEGVESNPWLEHPDLKTADGRVLTLRNPALAAREISDLADAMGDFNFHITSLKPLNPGNAPDDFERRALETFEKGAKEAWEWSPGGPRRVFRYMGALSTEKSCLACHEKQGYREGDNRGGISVSFDVERIERDLKMNIRTTALAAVVVVAIVLALVWLLVSRLRRQLHEARAELERAAISDPLTGLYNRRYATERLLVEVERASRGDLPLCCALFDADDFKKVNDDLGHRSGDMVLRAIASALRQGTRPYDLVARWGGEEFLVLLPRTLIDNAQAVCERLRTSVAESTAKALGGGRSVTVSVGVADFTYKSHKTGFDAGSHIDDLLVRADAALYRAKDLGKDRCEKG